MSSELGNTLVLKWITGTLSDQEREQLGRYAAIEAGDLASVLAVPVSATASHDVVLVLKESAVQTFRDHLAERGWSFPILRFEHRNPDYSLQKVEHNFQKSATDDFFGEGLALNRIPLGYLPFALDDITHASIVISVVRHLTALVLRDISEVGLPEFCSGYVPAWSYIDPSKQSEIAQTTRQLLTEICRERTGKLFIRRAVDDPTKWYLHQNAEFRRRLRFFQGFLDRFANRKQGEEDAPTLPLD